MNILYFKSHDFLDSDVTEIMFSTLKAAKKLSKFQLENILRSKLRYCANKAEISSGYQACVLKYIKFKSNIVHSSANKINDFQSECCSLR